MCHEIQGYTLISSSPGACDATCKASPELQALVSGAGDKAKGTGVSEYIEQITSEAADAPVKSKYSVEVLDGLESGKLKVRLCTGSVLSLPESLVNNVIGPVVSTSGDKSQLYVRVELDSSTPEGQLICQLAADIESLTNANRCKGDGQRLVGATAFDSGDTKVYLYGVTCKAGGNITDVTFREPITSYSLGTIGGDEGVFVISHRKLNSRTVRIVHDRTAVCGTSYRGDLVLYYDT